MRLSEINRSSIEKKNTQGEFYSINKNFNKGIVPFNISYLVESFSERKNYKALKSILNWQFLEMDVNFLQKLFDNKRFDEISFLIYEKNLIKKWKITENQFKIVIDNEECDLILFFLKINHCLILLKDHSVQNLIVTKYMKFGSKFYYGAEMLQYIYIISWNNELTK